jgi:hypothetical protein
MKSIYQKVPTVGTASPYSSDEWIRFAQKGAYLEVEIPIPNNPRTGPPEGYFLLYLFPSNGQSILLALPNPGVHEMIEWIWRDDVYVQAFRKKWSLFDSLMVPEGRAPVEIWRRPILVSVQDPDDGRTKWMVGRQVTVPPGLRNEILEVELQGLNSLMAPTLQLQVEAEDAMMRVGSGFMSGEFKLPKTKLEKFNEKYSEVLEMLGVVLDGLQPYIR